MTNIYKKHNYLNKNISYIKNSLIVEYDMKNAGLSILKHEELIDEKSYNTLMNKYNKHDRNVIVGKFLRDHSDISKELMDTFIKIRKDFFSLNNIEESDVLSIKKDAIFLVNKSPSYTKLNDDYIFRKKNIYNSYLKIRNIEFYYSMDTKKLDVKGMKKEVLEKQQDYFIKFIKECLDLDSNNKKDELFIKLLEFKDSFTQGELEEEFYRDLNENVFIFSYKDLHLSMENISESMSREYLDTRNNLNFLLELISSLLG